MNVQLYLFDRREGFITRWHAPYTQRTESLAEHQFFVTRNVLFLCRVLAALKIAQPTYLALFYAINHDQTEKIVGDVSGYTKRTWPQLKEVMTEIEENIINYFMFDNMPQELVKEYLADAKRAASKESLEAQIVGYVDLLDAYIFATTEVELGNVFMKQSLADLTGFLQCLDWPWLQQLREQTDLP